ncbi:cytochrome b6-f complex iron-sulfur subunit [Singulisphaera sp. GP187]|uniref:QcrA and Rieske domain-containing protein n=1 Tax=Singulisphaera sp. GP187 TaxID=1882752 RepID=UPI0009273440|nr:ubiquinol-cytochrome c reductase iron-sulfur subunit [Singulisphaera sp. GP187]SIO67272.1 cytochrome b6-f complex iron-sulfur subunit [Singulisphaera sp. GP187]
MAKRLSVKEMLEAARQGGPAKPADTEASAAPPETPDTPAVEPTAPVAAAAAPQPAPAANVPSAASLGRPLTLKEKLAAARAGGSVPPAPAAAASPVASAPEAAAASVADVAAAEPAAGPAVPAPAPSLGRPMTLKEKLAAARVGGTTPAASAATPAAGKPAGAAAAAGSSKAAAPRTLPPLDKITDPKDLAEALRQSGAKKAKESAVAAASKAAEAAGATPAKAATAGKAAAQKEAKPQSVLPKPSKATAGVAGVTRRSFAVTPVGWIILGWASFAAGVSLFSAMLGRFMFPNVLAEPPSTVKVGLPTNFEPEEVNERFKAEWGFWIVRSTRYNGEDIVYALQSVCTHLGCPPNWLGGEQKFKCPCHGSGFYISGVNFEGPAPRPLERFKVTLADDGQMLVDKSQKFQQELGQWSEPESYITA